MTKIEFKLKVFSLSERMYPMVVRLLGTNADAEDAIQEIMMKLWSQRKKLRNHPNIKGFVFLTARNYCIDVLRKKPKLVDDATNHFKVLKSTDNDRDIESEELSDIIYKILNDIPKQQKEVFLMRDIEGFDFPEIASTLKLKIEHVRVLLSRARKQIGLTLEKTYSYERGTY